MQIIIKSLFIILFTVLASHANAPVAEQKKLPLSQSLPLLKSINHHAIEIGHGAKDVYVFVDPFCPRSREFITLISQSKKMQSLYSYHIFLYELKRFKTKQLIESTYSSANPRKSMIRVMVNNEELKKSPPKHLELKKIAAIAKVAEAIHVYKRPYLVLVKKGKK